MAIDEQAPRFVWKNSDGNSKNILDENHYSLKIHWKVLNEISQSAANQKIGNFFMIASFPPQW